MFEQDLAREQRQERQEERHDRHADHVAEIGARRGQHVLEGVRERTPALLDATTDDVEVALEQNEVRSLARDGHGALDRETGVRGVHGRGVVDTVAKEPDDVPGLLEREDDALLLVRVHLYEQVREFRCVPKGLVVQFVKLLA